jgi:hypothetical protein
MWSPGWACLCHKYILYLYLYLYLFAALAVRPAGASSQGLYATAAGSGQLELVNVTDGGFTLIGPTLVQQVSTRDVHVLCHCCVMHAFYSCRGFGPSLAEQVSLNPLRLGLGVCMCVRCCCISRVAGFVLVALCVCVDRGAGRVSSRLHVPPPQLTKLASGTTLLRATPATRAAHGSSSCRACSRTWTPG